MKVSAWSAPGLPGSGRQVMPVTVTVVELIESIATMALLPAGRLNGPSRRLEAEAKSLTVPPVRSPSGRGRDRGRAQLVRERAGPTALTALTW